MSTTSFKNIVDILPGGLLITDTTSRVVYANESVSRRSGFAVAEIIGKKPGELWGGHMKQGFYQKLWQTIGAEQRPFIGAVENKKKNGELVREMLHIAPLQDLSGTTRYFIELHPVLHDMSVGAGFSQVFESRTKNWQHDPRTWNWAVDVLSGGASSCNLVSAPSELVLFIENEFVLPTAKTLSRRFEDVPLIKAAKEHPEAFEKLYVKYLPMVAGYFLRRIKDVALAEDLAQEVFTRAFRALPSFRITNASYLTYLLHICHNLLVNYYRKEAITPQVFLGEYLEEEAATTIAQVPGESFETLLQSLSPTERRVMLSTYRDGFRAKEIALKLGKTENAVKLILSRSRKKLRAVL